MRSWQQGTICIVAGLKLHLKAFFYFANLNKLAALHFMLIFKMCQIANISSNVICYVYASSCLLFGVTRVRISTCIMYTIYVHVHEIEAPNFVTIRVILSSIFKS